MLQAELSAVQAQHEEIKAELQREIEELQASSLEYRAYEEEFRKMQQALQRRQQVIGMWQLASWVQSSEGVLVRRAVSAWMLQSGKIRLEGVVAELQAEVKQQLHHEAMVEKARGEVVEREAELDRAECAEAMRSALAEVQAKYDLIKKATEDKAVQEAAEAGIRHEMVLVADQEAHTLQQETEAARAEVGALRAALAEAQMKYDTMKEAMKREIEELQAASLEYRAQHVSQSDAAEGTQVDSTELDEEMAGLFVLSGVWAASESP